MKKPSQVKPGDELYVRSSLYIDHGEDDVCGGIAVVDKVVFKEVPQNPVNSYFVYFVDLDHGYNLTILLQEQEKLCKEYGNRIAHQCPDVPGAKCPAPRRLIEVKKAVGYVTLNDGIKKTKIKLDAVPGLIADLQRLTKKGASLS